MCKRTLLQLVACFSLCSMTLAVWSAGPFDVRIAGEFSKVVDTNTAVLTTNASITLGTGTILEGPTWVPGTPGYLLFSVFTYANYGNTYAGLRKLVLPNTLTTNLLPPAYTVYNGSTLDHQERFITCQSGTAGLRVVMITNDTTVTTLVTNCNGLKFYSPNDVVVKSDGTIWFTDPGFNGNTATPPQPGYQTGHWVYRFDPADGNCSIVISNSAINRPNGLCFSPDESLLYLADYDARAIRVYSVSPSNTLSGGSVFITLPSGKGNPDGIRCDADGRVYSSANDGVYVYMPYPDSRLIGHIITSRGVNNLCFGGADGRALFIAAAPNIVSIPCRVMGTGWIKRLQISQMEDGCVQAAWPWPSTGFQLQSSFDPDAGTWTQVPYPPSVSNGLNLIELTPTNSAAFFRLCLPSP
jgi:gluconolactonase